MVKMGKKRGRCKHEFVAIPIAGQNALTGKEVIFGFRIECRKCRKIGDRDDKDKIVEIAASPWKQAIPEPIKLKNGIKDYNH